MKPGTILTNYKIIEPEKENNYSNSFCNSNQLVELKEKAQKEANEIICKAKNDAILEKEAILSKANLVLNEAIELKSFIENDYHEKLKNTYNLDINNFINEKNIEFLENLKEINLRFDSIFKSSKEDINEILLKTFEHLFGESYNNPQYIKDLLKHNFIGFEDSKNAELILSQDAFNEFTEEVKSELESELDIVLNSIKADKKLNGVILKTNLGSIEVDLKKQIQFVKENIENYTSSSN